MVPGEDDPRLERQLRVPVDRPVVQRRGRVHDALRDLAERGVTGHELAGVDVLPERVCMRGAGHGARRTGRDSAMQPPLPRRPARELERGANAARISSSGRSNGDCQKLNASLSARISSVSGFCAHAGAGGRRAPERDGPRDEMNPPQFAGGVCFSQTNRRRKSPIFSKVVTQLEWIIDSCWSSGMTVSS